MSSATEVKEPEAQQKQATSSSAPFTMPPLFATSLLEYADTAKRRRSGATLISFIVQCVLIGVFAILPLLFTEALPNTQLLTFLVAPPPPPPPPPPAAAIVKIVKQIQT